jgi:hypothetical protein
LPRELRFEGFVITDPASPRARLLATHLYKVLEEAEIAFGPPSLHPKGISRPFDGSGRLVLHLKKNPGEIVGEAVKRNRSLEGDSALTLPGDTFVGNLLDDLAGPRSPRRADFGRPLDLVVLLLGGALDALGQSGKHLKLCPLVVDDRSRYGYVCVLLD